METALRDLGAAVANARLDSSLAIRAMAALGRTDAAFTLMAQPQVDRSMDAYGVGFLLGPSTAPMRKDPQFWSIAARAGLADYWSRRGRWPDFCGREVGLAVCKAEAARALGQSR